MTSESKMVTTAGTMVTISTSTPITNTPTHLAPVRQDNEVVLVEDNMQHKQIHRAYIRFFRPALRPFGSGFSFRVDDLKSCEIQLHAPDDPSHLSAIFAFSFLSLAFTFLIDININPESDTDTASKLVDEPFTLNIKFSARDVSAAKLILECGFGGFITCRTAERNIYKKGWFGALSVLEDFCVDTAAITIAEVPLNFNIKRFHQVEYNFCFVNVTSSTFNVPPDLTPLHRPRH